MIEAKVGNIYKLKLHENEPDEFWMKCTKTVKTKYYFDIIKVNLDWRNKTKTWYTRKRFNDVHDVIEVFTPKKDPEYFL